MGVIVATKFRKVMVNRRLFTNGCKFLIPETVTIPYIKPNDLFDAIPVPYFETNPFGFSMTKTDIPNPDAGADDTHLWAYPAPHQIRFGGQYFLEKIKRQEILVVDDTMDDDPLLIGGDDEWTSDPFKKG
jgi:hypothetical protein